MSKEKTKIRNFRLETPYRVGTLTIREETTRTVSKLRFTKYGDFGDLEQIVDWLRPIYEKYDGDGKPLVADHPLFPQRMSAFDGGYSIITPLDS